MPAILVTDNTILVVPSQALTRVTLAIRAFAGWPAVGVPRYPNTGATAPTGAPLTAKMLTDLVEGLLDQGFDHLIFVSNHASNEPMCDHVAREVLPDRLPSRPDLPLPVLSLPSCAQDDEDLPGVRRVWLLSLPRAPGASTHIADQLAERSEKVEPEKKPAPPVSKIPPSLN